MTAEEKFMTAEEVAQLFRVGRAWVHAHASGRRKPHLKGIKVGPKSSKARWLFRRADVEEFIARLSRSLV